MPFAASKDYVTAEEASRLLGVGVQTVYTYVRRKGLRSVEVPGKRCRMYWRPDIDRLIGHGGSGNFPAVPSLGLDSAITVITSSGPFYRGQSAVGLSGWATLEHTAGILWNAPGAFEARSAEPPDGYRELRAAIRRLPVCEQAISVFAFLAAVEGRSSDAGQESFIGMSVKIAKILAALLSGCDWVSDEPIHALLARGLGAAAPFDDLLRRALVLGASHEFDPSSYAVRSAANTGVSPYHAAVVGLATYRGRRLAIDRWAAVISLVQDILSARRPADVVHDRLRQGANLPGFGSGVYKAGDPRADALLAAMTGCIGDDPALSRLQEAMAAARAIAGVGPDFILVNAFLSLRLGRRPGDVTFTVCARIVGWLAQAMEQSASPGMVRPRANYVGPLPRATMPLANR